MEITGILQKSQTTKESERPTFNQMLDQIESDYSFGFRRFISPKNEIAASEDKEKMLEEELAAIRAKRPAKGGAGIGLFAKKGGRPSFNQNLS